MNEFEKLLVKVTAVLEKLKIPHLILIKLLWYKDSESTRHLEDAESIVAIQGEKLDRQYLEQWAKEQDTLGLLTNLFSKHS